MSVTAKSTGSLFFKIFAYGFCFLLAVVSLFPFVIMAINATRSSEQIQQHVVSLIPSVHFSDNLRVLLEESFNPVRGFVNSMIISVCSTICAVYFSTMTAYALVAYDWRLKRSFFTLIMCVLMIPAQVSSIGFYHFVCKIGLTNSFLALILPTIASPTVVFFMRQYMLPSLPMEIVQSARIDGAGEIRIFNQIVLPMMKPALATQAIFSFVTSWDNLFMPQIILIDSDRHTLPIMVSRLNGGAYRTEYGAVYLGLLLTVLPVIVVYFALSKHIISGVALGGVKG